MQLYQKTYGIDCHVDRVCVVTGQVWLSPEDAKSKGEDKGYIIIQPLLRISQSDSETVPEYTYKQDGHSICVDYDVFMGACGTGQPNYEKIGDVNDMSLLPPASSFVCGISLEQSLRVFTEYWQYRIRMRHDMLHVLGWYRNVRTKQVVRFLGTALIRTEPYVVLQRLHEGSVDPAVLHPVFNADPINEDGQHDIWNGLELVPMQDFTSMCWVSETNCQLLYEYLGLEYSEATTSDVRQ